MDGVFLSAQLAELRERSADRLCMAVGIAGKDALGLVLGEGMLVLSARPDRPALWWSAPRKLEQPVSAAWGHHLEGGRVLSVTQPGSDRVAILEMSSGLLYGESGVRLIFEAAGRNANIVLVRILDGRVLACWRNITRERCRVRSISPGSVYQPPPPSGLHPGEWTTDRRLVDAMRSGEATAESLYRGLEGVGPVTARAILGESALSGETVDAVVIRLERALLDGDLRPWMALSGPVPIPLGPGEPITDPLSESLFSGSAGNTPRGNLDEWISLLRTRAERAGRKLEKLDGAISGLVPPDTSRLWGNLLLASGDRSRGRSEVLLTDWEGVEHRIPLRPNRTTVENAGRYFRKASRADMEERNLRRLAEGIRRDLKRIEEDIRKAPGLPPEKIDALLAETSRRRKRSSSGPTTTPPLVLSGGWRCFVGRNAADNDRVTFSIGRKGDIWFHARGLTGPHVVLKIDGRVDNPPERVIIEAAAEAARGSGVTSGVIPVDHTRVQYVRKVRQGKPGQVVYTREKTVFIDLSSLSSRDRRHAGRLTGSGEV